MKLRSIAFLIAFFAIFSNAHGMIKKSNWLVTTFNTSLLKNSKKYFNFYRFISSDNLKNTYNCLTDNAKPYSPVHGAALIESPFLKNMYDYGANEHAMVQLSRKLFHKNGSQFHPTRNKSLPAASLNPEIIGELIGMSASGELKNPEKRNEFINFWKQEHKKQLDGSLSNGKIEKFIQLFENAQAESNLPAYNEKLYLPHLAETMLGAILYRKTEEKKEIFDFFDTLNSHIPAYNATKKTKLINDNFDIVQINFGTSEWLKQDKYEEAIFELISPNKKKIAPKPVLQQAKVPYKQYTPVANCVEASFHGILNELLFNPETQQFDFAMLPESIKPHKSLQDFYQDSNNQTNFNSNKSAAHWMDLVSAHEFLEYHKSSEKYELLPRVNNLIKLMNFFFDHEATQIEELDTLFSSDKQSVHFKKNQNNITININKRHVTRTITLKLSSFHAELETPQTDKAENLPNWYNGEKNQIYTKTLFEKSAKNNDLAQRVHLAGNFSKLFKPADLLNACQTKKNSQRSSAINKILATHTLFSCNDLENHNTIPKLVTTLIKSKYTDYYKTASTLIDKLLHEDWHFHSKMKKLVLENSELLADDQESKEFFAQLFIKLATHNEKIHASFCYKDLEKYITLIEKAKQITSTKKSKMFDVRKKAKTIIRNSGSTFFFSYEIESAVKQIIEHGNTNHYDIAIQLIKLADTSRGETEWMSELLLHKNLCQQDEKAKALWTHLFVNSRIKPTDKSREISYEQIQGLLKKIGDLGLVDEQNKPINILSRYYCTDILTEIFNTILISKQRSKNYKTPLEQTFFIKLEQVVNEILSYDAQVNLGNVIWGGLIGNLKLFETLWNQCKKQNPSNATNTAQRIKIVNELYTNLSNDHSFLSTSKKKNTFLCNVVGILFSKEELRFNGLVKIINTHKLETASIFMVDRACGQNLLSTKEKGDLLFLSTIFTMETKPYVFWKTIAQKMITALKKYGAACSQEQEMHLEQARSLKKEKKYTELEEYLTTIRTPYHIN